VPFKTPPETGFVGRGAGLGGGSSPRFTIGTGELLFTATVFASTEPLDTLVEDVLAVGSTGAAVEVFLR